MIDYNQLFHAPGENILRLAKFNMHVCQSYAYNVAMVTYHHGDKNAIHQISVSLLQEHFSWHIYRADTRYSEKGKVLFSQHSEIHTLLFHSRPCVHTFTQKHLRRKKKLELNFLSVKHVLFQPGRHWSGYETQRSIASSDWNLNVLYNYRLIFLG